MSITDAVREQNGDRIAAAYDAAVANGMPQFAALPAEVQTVIVSVGFQYGTRSTATPNFWRQITTGDWAGALANLRSFGDRYATRRRAEADYLEPALRREGMVP